MNLIDRLKTRWQEWTGEEDTPFDGDAPAWAVSLGVHFVGVLILGLWFLPEVRNVVTLTVAPVKEEEVQEIETIIEKVYVSEEKTEDIAANSEAGADSALAQAQTFAEESVVAHEPVEERLDATVNIDVSIDKATSPVVHPTMNVRGSPIGTGVTGAAGAVDRLTYEILDSLEQRKTLVVWLFDSTLSLKSQRAEIGSRFSRIYEELGVLEQSKNEAFTKHDDKPLLSAAISYGRGQKLLTQEPTDDVKELNELVKGIEADDSGDENTFTAVLAGVSKFGSYRTEKKRNVMFVVVTDEVGSDSMNSTVVEQAIAATRRYQIPVYVVGVPAPFGRVTIPFRYVSDDPKFEETEYWIPVEQGPESRFPELVKLAFWGEKNQEQYDYIDSGFGPYQLTRLCAETGGLYFSVHPNRTAQGRAMGRGGRGQTPKNSSLLYTSWDPAVMRPYTPEYMTDSEYDRFVKSNKCREQLLIASRESNVKAMDNPALRFVKKDEGTLSNLITEAQKASASLGPKLNTVLSILKQGEADRPKLTGPRWQAGFDLSMGRLLAAVVRTDGYNMMLAQAKASKPFKDPKNNTWVLEPSTEISTGSSAQKQADMAKMYLERVVKEHEGTPWAMLAKKELETPFGWTWKEEFTEIPKEGAGGGGGAAANPADALNKMKRKPEAPKPKL